MSSHVPYVIHEHATTVATAMAANTGCIRNAAVGSR